MLGRDGIATRRWGAVLLLACVIAVAAGTWLVLAGPTRAAKPHGLDLYLAPADRICAEHGRQLDRIPPVLDPSVLGDVLAAVNAALPILREQEAQIRKLQPPSSLRPQVAAFFALSDRSIAELESVRAAAKTTNTAAVASGLIRFRQELGAAKRLARRIGYRC